LTTSISEPRKWLGDIHPPLRYLVATEAAPRNVYNSDDPVMGVEKMALVGFWEDRQHC
ncbi:hypothetical protein U1Q18_048877, partial [Sarracenia purpurea var. burkii]